MFCVGFVVAEYRPISTIFYKVASLDDVYPQTAGAPSLTRFNFNPSMDK